MQYQIDIDEPDVLLREIKQISDYISIDKKIPKLQRAYYKSLINELKKYFKKVEVWPHC